MTTNSPNEDRRPMAYPYTTWHTLMPQFRTLVAPRMLDQLEHACGTVPEALDTERAVLAFANEAGIPLVEADLEATGYLPLPDKHHASRAWVPEEYLRFRAWAVQEGWIQPLVAQEVPAERPRRRRSSPAAAGVEPVPTT
jgi:hypothetical protein